MGRLTIIAEAAAALANLHPAHREGLLDADPNLGADADDHEDAGHAGR